MIFTIPIHEANDCHLPAGSPEGGRFCAKSGVDQGGDADFQAWFKGSVVTDAKGRPERVFHATNANFADFRAGSHFGSAKGASDRFEALHHFSVNVVGRDPGQFQTTPVYLKIENPLRLPDLASLPDTSREEDEEGNLFMRSWESETDLPEVLYEQGVLDRDEFWDHQYDTLEELIPLLRSKGYDGIVYENVVEDPGHDSWIIFDPTQVRRALR